MLEEGLGVCAARLKITTEEKITFIVVYTDNAYIIERMNN